LIEVFPILEENILLQLCNIFYKYITTVGWWEILKLHSSTEFGHIYRNQNETLIAGSLGDPTSRIPEISPQVFGEF
jgi:hypothetical protein